VSHDANTTPWLSTHNMQYPYMFAVWSLWFSFLTASDCLGAGTAVSSADSRSPSPAVCTKNLSLTLPRDAGTCRPSRRSWLSFSLCQKIKSGAARGSQKTRNIKLCWRAGRAYSGGQHMEQTLAVQCCVPSGFWLYPDPWTCIDLFRVSFAQTRS